MSPLFVLGALALWLSTRSRDTASAHGLPSEGRYDGTVPSRRAPAPAPAEAPSRELAAPSASSPSSASVAPAEGVTRERVAAAQAGFVRLSQGHLAPGEVRELQRAIGADVDGRVGPRTRARLALLLGDAGERVSPSSSPAQRAARRLAAHFLATRGRMDPVIVRGFQSVLPAPATGVMDSHTALRLRELFSRA